MTNGMISTTASAASSAVAGVSAATVKTGSSNGFSGALVQAMGSTGGEGSTASGTALPAGLLGLMGLLGSQTSEQSSQQTSQELLQLLSGLSKQLEGLDPNAELPGDMQTQLAGLLLLFQNLLTQMGIMPVDLKNNEASISSALSESVDVQPQGTQSANSLPVVHNLQQSMMQLSAILSNGTALPADTAAFTQQLQQTMSELTSLSSAGQSSNAQTTQVVTQQNALQQAANTSVQSPASSPAEMEPTASAAAPEVRRSTPALRNPVWQFQMTNAEEATSVEGTVTPTAIEPSESAGQNGSAPAWTFLGTDNAGMTTAASASSTATSAQVPVQQFAEQMGKYLVKQFLLTQGNGTHEARIQLHPEHLGQVDIKIMIQNGQLTAHFVTENGAARDLLENQMSQLRTALQGQGLQVERMEVVQQSANSAAASFFQQNQRQPGSGQNGNGGNGRGASRVYDDTAGFEAELDRTTYLREVGYGSALNVKA